MPLIFQYGSNCDADRLNSKERLNGTVEDRGRAQTVDEYDIAFNKWSTENKRAAADLVKPRNGGRRIWGVVYQDSRAAFKKLKGEIEGPSYRPQRIMVVDAIGATKRVTTFRVKRKSRRTGLYTTEEYVAHIVKGLRAHGVEDLDPAYIQHIIDVAVRTNAVATDPQNAERAADESRLIESLRRQPKP